MGRRGGKQTPMGTHRSASPVCGMHFNPLQPSSQVRVARVGRQHDVDLARATAKLHGR